jgi:hypothetical protein
MPSSRYVVNHQIRLLCISFITLSYVVSIAAQENVQPRPSPSPTAQETPRPDRWRGLVIDESTPEDIIRLFGQPRADRNERMHLDPIERWFTRRQRERIFRRLEYRNLEGIDKAWFYFDNNKLAQIMLDLDEEVAAQALPNIYNLQFRPVIGRFAQAVTPQNFPREQGQVYPREYPIVYHLVSVSDRTVVLAMINNVPSILGALSRSAGIPDQAGEFPGKVQFLQIISRTLENRDGSDVLR